MPNDNVALKNNCKVYITNGALKVSNGSIRLQNAELYAKNSTINAKTELVTWSGTCRIDIKDSYVKVGTDFSNESGIRRLENVCLEVGGDYTCGYTVGKV